MRRMRKSLSERRGHHGRRKTEAWIKNFVSSAENVRISVHRESGRSFGQEYPVKTLVKELMKDLMFYEQSGGGVTLSGGEVMAMSTDYVLAIAKAFEERRSIAYN